MAKSNAKAAPESGCWEVEIHSVVTVFVRGAVDEQQAYAHRPAEVAAGSEGVTDAMEPIFLRIETLSKGLAEELRSTLRSALTRAQTVEAKPDDSFIGKWSRVIREMPMGGRSPATTTPHHGGDAEEKAWREGWAFAYSGTNLYGDDGELQDSRHPMIDWRRDSAQEIRAKIYQRAEAALATPANADDGEGK